MVNFVCFTTIKKKIGKNAWELFWVVRVYTWTLPRLQRQNENGWNKLFQKKKEHDKFMKHWGENAWRISLCWPAIVSRLQDQTVFLELNSFKPEDIFEKASTLNSFRPIQRILVQNGSWLAAFHKTSSKLQVKQAPQRRDLEKKTLKKIARQSS